MASPRKPARSSKPQQPLQRAAADKCGRDMMESTASASLTLTALRRAVARRHSRLAPLYSDSRPRISSSTTTLVEPLCLSATGVALLVSYA